MCPHHRQDDSFLVSLGPTSTGARIQARLGVRLGSSLAGIQSQSAIETQVGRSSSVADWAQIAATQLLRNSDFSFS